MRDWKSEIRQRLAGLKLEPTREAEIIEELSQHLEDRYSELRAGGAADKEAYGTAIVELSDSQLLARQLERVEQQVPQEPVVLGAGRPNMIADLFQDLRYSVRSLRKHAMLSIIVIATLTLGIGITTGVFAYCNAAGLRAPVDKDFDSFVRVYSAYTKDPLRPGRPSETTLEDYLAFRDGAKSIRELAAFSDIYVSLGQDDPREVRALLVTSNFFSVYDLERPLMGRLPQTEDEASANPVVVLSERLWRNRFAADPQIVGRVLHLQGQPVTVVGVTPNFAGMVNGARAWFPYTLETYLKHGDNLLRPGEVPWLHVDGRLNPGYSHQDAEAEFKLIASQQDRLHPGRTTTLAVTDGSAIQDPQDGANVRLGISVLVGALFVFVLIVCVNISTLLLSRSAARRHEIAVRIALGAGRLRLIRMLLTESFLLASIAGLASLYLAYNTPDLLDYWLINRRFETASRDFSVAPDWRVFVYLTLATILAGTFAGLTPALQSLKVNLTEMLKGRQSMIGGTRGARFYGLLIGTQIAMSFFLLYGAVIFVGTAEKAASFEPGFETRQVLSMTLLMQSRGPGQRTWGAFHRNLTERLSALPGAQSVAYAGAGPFRNGTSEVDVQIPGQPIRQAGINWVSPGFFTTLGIPIVTGRAFVESDPPCGKAGCSVVVSERFAREFWPDENPLGQTFQDPEGHLFEVIGVAGDVSSTKLGALDGAMVYRPFDFNRAHEACAFVRFSGDSAALGGLVTSTTREIAPELTFWAAPQTIQSFREDLMESIWGTTQLIALICLMAVSLAVIGIYGVVAFAVSQRTKEIGIRLALGAQKKDIYRAVLATSGRPVAIGLLFGLAITVVTWSAALAPLLRPQEFTFNASEPIAYGVTVILLSVGAAAAMLIPARRATRVDPIVALRQD